VVEVVRVSEGYRRGLSEDEVEGIEVEQGELPRTPTFQALE
jgi:hypothetical protein